MLSSPFKSTSISSGSELVLLSFLSLSSFGTSSESSIASSASGTYGILASSRLVKKLVFILGSSLLASAFLFISFLAFSSRTLISYILLLSFGATFVTSLFGRVTILPNSLAFRYSSLLEIISLKPFISISLELSGIGKLSSSDISEEISLYSFSFFLILLNSLKSSL